MGFAATVRNNSSGTVSGIAVQQSLPPGSGVAWSVASQSGSSGTVGGTPASQTLACSIANLGAEPGRENAAATRLPDRGCAPVANGRGCRLPTVG